jgi:hypothetical protein
MEYCDLGSLDHAISDGRFTSLVSSYARVLVASCTPSVNLSYISPCIVEDQQAGNVHHFCCVQLLSASFHESLMLLYCSLSSYSLSSAHAGMKSIWK